MTETNNWTLKSFTAEQVDEDQIEVIATFMFQGNKVIKMRTLTLGRAPQDVANFLQSMAFELRGI